MCISKKPCVVANGNKTLVNMVAFYEFNFTIYFFVLSFAFIFVLFFMKILWPEITLGAFDVHQCIPMYVCDGVYHLPILYIFFYSVFPSFPSFFHNTFTYFLLLSRSFRILPFILCIHSFPFAICCWEDDVQEIYYFK